MHRNLSLWLCNIFLLCWAKAPAYITDLVLKMDRTLRLQQQLIHLLQKSLPCDFTVCSFRASLSHKRTSIDFQYQTVGNDNSRGFSGLSEDTGISAGSLAELTREVLELCNKILMVYTEQRKPREGCVRVLLNAEGDAQVVFD